MKNYFKNYYRQRLTNKILNENYDGLREQIKENVLKVHLRRLPCGSLLKFF